MIEKIEGKMKILIQAWVHVPDLRDRSAMEMKEEAKAANRATSIFLANMIWSHQTSPDLPPILT